ncbi:MAG: WYL domain-containing protein [Acidimicrobiia bacterium]
MAALAKDRHFEVLRAVLALVEEQGSAPLADAAAAAGVDEGTLRELLDPVLYLAFRTATGELLQETNAFLLTEDDVLCVTGSHWLRDLAGDPPAPDVALRLLIAALTVQTLSTRPTPDLDDAVKKLRGVVAVDLNVPVELPPCLDVVRRAWHEGRSVRMRYLADAASHAQEMEVLPHRVFCRWGHWYLVGRLPAEDWARTFRVDRMQDAAVGDERFEAPDDVEIPEWFDLSAHERTVRVRCTPEVLDVLPQPARAGETTAVGADQVEVDITVNGDRRLEHLLVCLPPDAEVVGPAEYKQLRRDHASHLLAAFTD